MRIVGFLSHMSGSLSFRLLAGFYEDEQGVRGNARGVYYWVLASLVACLHLCVLPNEIPAQIPHGDSSVLELRGRSLAGFDYPILAGHDEAECRHLFGGFLAECTHKGVDCVGDFRCHIGNSEEGEGEQAAAERRASAFSLTGELQVPHRSDG